MEEVDKVPKVAKEALVESAVALMRLRETQKQGIKDQTWRDHVLAWLVSILH